MIELKNVSFSFGEKRVLKNISLEVNNGEFLAILGANGAGKSTLMKIMSGILRPKSGIALINSRDISELGALELAQERAVLEQDCELSFDYTVAEVVSLGAYSSKAPTKAFISKCLASVGLSNFEERVYTQLSGGEQRRVQTARVLMQIGESPKGKTLFLDEPSAGLDPAHSHMSMLCAQKLAKQNASIIAVLHDPNLAAAYADKIAVIKNGELSAFGEIEEVFTQETFENAYETKCEILNSKHGKIAIFPKIDIK